MNNMIAINFKPLKNQEARPRQEKIYFNVDMKWNQEGNAIFKTEK
jgi:hypothetical protein